MGTYLPLPLVRSMLRLTVLLCAALFVTLLIGGDDKGQMRPGLARAIAAGEEITVIERRWTPVAEVVPAVVKVKEILSRNHFLAAAEAAADGEAGS